MKICKQIKNVMLTLALTFMMTLAFSILVNAAPAAVTGVHQVDAGENSIRVEWDSVLNANDIRYEVSVSEDKIDWTIVEDNTSLNSLYISNGMSAGRTYYVRVRSYIYSYGTPNEYSASYSTPVECVTAPNSKPSTLSKTNSTTTSMTLQWSAVSGANAYQIKYYEAGTSSNIAKQVIVTGTSTTLQKLAKNTSYNVQIKAIRRNSANTYTAIAFGTTYEYDLGVTPSKVTGVEVDYYWYYINQISVEYKNIDSADGYLVEAWTAYKAKDTKVASGTTADKFGVDLAKAAFGKKNMYKIRVRAYSLTSTGKKIYGAWSAWKYTSPQPEVTAMRSTKSGIKIAYDKIAGADKYVIYASTKQKSGYKKVGTTSKTSYTLTKFNKKALKSGKTYYVYVVAYNKVGKKLYSAEAGNANSCWSLKYEK